jgi:hypothetical protein
MVGGQVAPEAATSPVAQAGEHGIGAPTAPEEVVLPATQPGEVHTDEQGGGTSAVSEAVTHPAVQPDGGEVKASMVPEVSVQPQDATNSEGPIPSGGDVSALQVKLEDCLLGPEELAVEIPMPLAPAVTTMIEATGTDPSEPTPGATGVESFVVVSPATVVGVLVDPPLRTTVPNADVVLIEDSPRRDL